MGVEGKTLDERSDAVFAKAECATLDHYQVSAEMIKNDAELEELNRKVLKHLKTLQHLKDNLEEQGWSNA